MAKHKYNDGMGNRKVTLDGIEIYHVIACDTVAGWVEKYRTEPDGSFVIVNGMVQIEKLYGKVTVDHPQGGGTDNLVTHTR